MAAPFSIVCANSIVVGWGQAKKAQVATKMSRPKREHAGSGGAQIVF